MSKRVKVDSDMACSHVKFTDLRPPRSSQYVYKDECCHCFYSQVRSIVPIQCMARLMSPRTPRRVLMSVSLASRPAAEHLVGITRSDISI